MVGEAGRVCLCVVRAACRTSDLSGALRLQRAITAFPITANELHIRQYERTSTYYLVAVFPKVQLG